MCASAGWGLDTSGRRGSAGRPHVAAVASCRDIDPGVAARPTRHPRQPRSVPTPSGPCIPRRARSGSTSNSMSLMDACGRRHDQTKSLLEDQCSQGCGGTGAGGGNADPNEQNMGASGSVAATSTPRYRPPGGRPAPGRLRACRSCSSGNGSKYHSESNRCRDARATGTANQRPTATSNTSSTPPARVTASMAADGQHEAFGVAVRARTPRRDLDHLDARIREHRVERACVLPGPITDEEPEPRYLFAQVHDEVAGLLRGPRSVRVRGHAQDVQVAVIDLEREQHLETPA